MPGFRVSMFGSSPFPVPAAEVERGMSCMYLLILFKLFIPVAIRTVRHEAKFYTNPIETTRTSPPHLSPSSVSDPNI